MSGPKTVAVLRPARTLAHRCRGLCMWGALFIFCASIGAWLYSTVYRWHSREEIALVTTRLDAISTGLDMELARFEALPEVIALDTRLSEALVSPADPRLVSLANEYLRSSRQHSGSDVTYLMDARGVTLASSNFDTADSFVGKNYGFRPYVKDALRGQRGRYYAIGATTGRAGYFLAAPVRRGTEVIGVLAVKASLDDFESAMRAGGGEMVLVDSAGVTLLASEPAMRYRTLQPLSASQVEEIQSSQQFGGMSLKPLTERMDLRAGSLDGVQLVDPLLSRFDLVLNRPVGKLGWRLVAFSEASASRRIAVLAAAIWALASIGLAQAYAASMARRERRVELLHREREIEARIERATRQLQGQLAEQERIESTLRATTDASVQAGKLAILGQMSAAISHELNQPLTAMRNYTANTLVLMEQGQSELARRNLERIDRLAERMGQLVGQLRSYVRKQPGPSVPVRFVDVLDSARELLQTLLKTDTEITFTISPPDLQVLAQRARLEQVMINLLRNAIEAVPCGDPPCVSAQVEGPFVVVEVRDHGPGLTPEVLAKLFEPFFTTKAPGQGLGLGLALSQMIVRELGGELSALNAEGGGSLFRIRLPAILERLDAPQ